VADEPGSINTANPSVVVESERQAPPAIAPNLVAVPETCMGSVAAGASSPFGGISFGTTYKSDDCERRMYARALQALGHDKAALALLAQSPQVAQALRDARVEVPKATSVSSTIKAGSGPWLIPASKDPERVQCTATETKIRAANGEWFCSR
jgi:hypothetical protein